MTTLRDHPPAGTPPASPKAPRGPVSASTPATSIVLRQPGDADTFVDGGWWPRSLDLVAELPPLLTAVEAAGYGEVRRVSYALTAWDGRPPRKSPMLNRVTKLGGFQSQDPAEISLIDGSDRKRIIVLVVPPGTDPDVAHRALSMAGTKGDKHRAREILELARPPHSPPDQVRQSGCVDEKAAASWDSEGGRVTP